MNLSHRTVPGRRQSLVSGLAAVRVGADARVAKDSTLSLPWYVVHTKVRQEQTAGENLARQGYAVYLPKIKILKRSRGRQQAQLEALFPRYIFLQPGSATHSIAPVRSTLGVTALVRFGQEPAVMRPETLQGIRDFEARRNEASDEDISPFQRGERVRVVDGPLTGLEGLISDVSQQRVVVLMQLLGQDTRVSLSQHQLLVAN
ncbi:MAG: transcriptional activator RfaH [Sulfuritalea sp.]|jgi:transcriptional antiterminator RfaH|nr:transcriptional activator RfaH [Sulfuritalea sp.]